MIEHSSKMMTHADMRGAMTACALAVSVFFWLYGVAAVQLFSTFAALQTTRHLGALLGYLCVCVLFLIPPVIELWRSVDRVMTFREGSVLLWLSLSLGIAVPFAVALGNLRTEMPVDRQPEALLFIQVFLGLFVAIAASQLMWGAFVLVPVFALFSRTRRIAARMGGFGIVGAVASVSGMFLLERANLLKTAAPIGVAVMAFAYVVICIAAIEFAKMISSA